MSVTPIVTKYPLDITGESIDNLVLAEVHNLPNRPIRAIAPSYGAFFTESLVVRDMENNRILERDVDYYPAELYEVPSSKYGKEICAIILIINPNVASEIEIDYQVLGGPWEVSQDAIVNMLNSLDMDDRPVEWGNIINKPLEFNPAHHLHDIGDLYGFEYVVAELERIYQAIIIGDAASHELILDYFDMRFDATTDYIDDEIRILKDYSDNTFETQGNAQSNYNRIDQAILDSVNASKQYTDDEISGLKLYVDQQDQDLNSTLRSWADNKFKTKSEALTDHNNIYTAINDALNSSKSYTDQQIANNNNTYIKENYISKNSEDNGSIRISGGNAQIRVDGAWKTFWPPQWQ